MNVRNTPLLQANYKTALAAGAIAAFSITGIVMSILGLKKMVNCPSNMPIPVLALSATLLAGDMAWIGAICFNHKKKQTSTVKPSEVEVEYKNQQEYDEYNKQKNMTEEILKALRTIQEGADFTISLLEPELPKEKGLELIRTYQETIRTANESATKVGIGPSALDSIDRLRQHYKKDKQMMKVLNSWHSNVKASLILIDDLVVCFHRLESKRYLFDSSTPRVGRGFRK